MIYNQFGRHITFLRSDNGTEFKNSSFSMYCSAYGITQQFTTPDAPNQNGVSERLNLTLLDATRAMLHASKLSPDFWNEAVLNAVYTRNRSPSSSTGKCTPYELYYGHKPNVSHLQIFGTPCFAITTPYQRRNTGTFKLADRSKKCIFMGYSSNSKSYRLLNETGKITLARYEDTLFTVPCPPNSHGPTIPPGESSSSIPLTLYTPSADDDNTSFYTVDSDLDSPVTHQPAEILSVPPNDQPFPPSPTPDSPEESPSPSADPEDASNEFPTITPIAGQPGLFRDPRYGTITLQPISDPPSRSITAPPRYPKRACSPVDYSSAFTSLSMDPYAFCMTDTTDALHQSCVEWYKLPPAFARSANGEQLPATYDAIATLTDKEEWQKATSAEIASLIEHGTWTLVPLPPGRKALKTKWVFRIKRDAHGNITRYKARLCACGYSQLPGIDYKEIYSPVVISSLSCFVCWK
jgi:hypothetical protein